MIVINNNMKKCLLCSKENENNFFLNIHEKFELINGLNKLNIEIPPLKDHIDWVCYTCTYKISTIHECTTNWLDKIKKSRINYYYSLGEKEMVRRLLSSNSVSGQDTASDTGQPARSLSTRTSASSVDNERNEVNSMEASNQFKWKLNNLNTCTNTVMTPGSSEVQNGNTSINNQTLNQSSDTDNHALLTVMHEHSESVLATESGGKINGYYNLTNKPAVEKVLLQCKYCPRTFRRPSYFMKHEKKHDKKSVSVRSGRSIVQCPICGISFNKTADYKKHAIVHQTKMKCSYCPMEFTVLNNFDIHEAECFGKLCANGEVELPMRYITRSLKSIGCKKVAQTNRYLHDDEVSIADSTYTTRQRNTRNWVKQTTFNSFDRHETHCVSTNYDEDDAESYFSNLTRASSHLTNFDIADSNNLSSESKRRKRLKKGEFNKAENKRSKRYQTCFLCPDLNCNFSAYDIKILLEHDITIHEELPLFRCKKCDGRFLRKCYLDYHVMNQDPGRFVCNKCEEIFTFECDLKNHIQLHNNTESHCCIYCNLKFLHEANWHNHIITPRHFERKEFLRKSIFIVKNSYPILGNQILLQVEEENAKKIIVKPYKSEIRITHFLEPDIRRSSSKYPIWKPGDINVKSYNGYIYPDCAARPYK